MRSLLIIFLLMVLTMGLHAQQIVSRDTINIHGFIYDSEGKPVNFMYIQSTQNEIEHNIFKASAFTNERGYFEIKGARLNDTLTLGPDVNYNLQPYYNSGSRMIVIYLPPMKTVDITSIEPLVITAKRQIPRAAATFKVTPVENKLIKNSGGEEAKYPGGMTALVDFIRQNMQYPASAVKANIEGEVEITFTINKDGLHRNFKIVRGLTDECDSQVLQALKKSADWEPAHNNNNQAVAMQERMVVQFKLTN